MELAPKAELMRSLGRLVRGLSALFWGLPLALVVCVKSAITDWIRPLGILPPMMITGLLLFGVVQLGYFQKQERVWRLAVERTLILGVVNIGLSPFIYWWNKLPFVQFYAWAVGLLMLTSLLFLLTLNQLLQRLAAMLPDETLRMETRVFGSLNLYLLCAVIGLSVLYFSLRELPWIPDALLPLLQILDQTRQWFTLFLILLPLATTMTLIWKIKEVVFSSVFSPE